MELTKLNKGTWKRFICAFRGHVVTDTRGFPRLTCARCNCLNPNIIFATLPGENNRPFQVVEVVGGQPLIPGAVADRMREMNEAGADLAQQKGIQRPQGNFND